MRESGKTFKTGILGAGHISEFHLQAMGRLPNVNVIGIADVDVQAAEKRAAVFKIPNVRNSIDGLLSLCPDVIHVLTPPASHANLTIQALQHGCHVFVEKPLAESVADCDRILEAAKNANRIVSIDHSLLRDPFTKKALQITRSGKIGSVIGMQLIRSQNLPVYTGGPLPAQYRKGGFPFRDLGIHALYQTEAFLGEIKDIDFRFCKLGTDWNLQFDDWRATVECQFGTAHIYVSWNARPLQDVMMIHGTAGTILVDRFAMRVLTKRSNGLPEHPQRLFNAMQESVQTAIQVPVNVLKILTRRIRRYHGLQEMVHEFYRRLADSRTQIVTAEDARRVSFWVERVATSADKQKEQARNSYTTEMNAKILVTGATGLIGRELLNRLLKSGERIRVLVRRPPSDELLNASNVEVVLGDLGDPAAVQRATAGIERIYHVGGTTHGDEHDFIRGNMAGTNNIIASGIKNKIQQLIYISSLSVLHSSTFEKGKTIDESWPLESSPELRGTYTKTKLLAERAVVNAVSESQLPAVILRPAEVIGSGAPPLSSGVAQRVGNLLLILGDGNLEVPLVNVKDLVDAILLSAERQIANGSIIHVVDPQTKSQNQLVREYLKIKGCKNKTIYIPRWFLYAAGFAMQCLCGLLKRSAPLSVYRLKSALTTRSFRSDVASRLLAWQPQQGIEKGLQDAHSRSETQADTTDSRRIANNENLLESSIR